MKSHSLMSSERMSLQASTAGATGKGGKKVALEGGNKVVSRKL